MTLFGTELDLPTIATLLGLGATLVLWLIGLRGERRASKWFSGWNAERKARRDAELAAERGEPPSDTPRGPWG